MKYLRSAVLGKPGSKRRRLAFHDHSRTWLYTRWVPLMAGLAGTPLLISCSGEEPAFTSTGSPQLDVMPPAEVDPNARDADRMRQAAADAEGRGPATDGNGGSEDGSNPVGGAESSSSPTSDGTTDQTSGQTGQRVGGGSSGQTQGQISGQTRSLNPTERSQTFLAQQTRPASGVLQLGGETITHDIVIESRIQRQSARFKQSELPSASEIFNQGRGQQKVVESFNQSSAGVLDLLIVIDNSGSMQQEQANLSSKMAPLLGAVATADWRIAVTTTDPADGCLRSLIQKGQEGADSAFAAAVTAGTAGNGNEQGIRQAVAALSCPTAQWVRESSSLAVLIVSDEDNCSKDGADCGTNPWAKETYLTSFMTDKMARKLGSDARIYGIFGHPDDKSCKTAANPATQYARAVTQTQGTWGSICAQDYTATLTQISRDVATILKNQFALKAQPAAGTVTVNVMTNSGQTRTPWKEFNVAGNIITFSQPPPAGSDIEVSYATPGEPQLTAVGLAEVPFAGKVNVYVNDIKLEPSEYVVAGKQVQFLNTPPPSARISVSYQKNVDLLSSFAIGSGITAASIQLTVNGQEVRDFQYDPAAGLLRTPTPPAPGSTIEASFDRVVGIRTSYPSPVQASEVVALAATFEDGSPAGVQLTPTVDSEGRANTSLVLSDPASAQAGSHVSVTLKVKRPQTVTLQLPSTPVQGTLELKASDPSCSMGQGISVSGAMVSISCGTMAGLDIAYEYQEVSQPRRSYDVRSLMTSGKVAWTVTIDGTRKLDPSAFAIQQGTLTLGDEVALEDAASVTVAARSTDD